MNTAAERQKVKSMSTKELVEFYNAATGKSIKRFRDRATAESQVLKAMAAAAPAPAPSAPGTKAGRPVKNTHVALNGEGETSPHPKSLRGKVLAMVKASATPEAPNIEIDTLRKTFGARVRGAVQKLVESKHLKRVTVA